MTATMGPETTSEHADADQYLDAVRSHLSDLEPDELEDMLDDLRQHLREVRIESDAPFATILGQPDAFADELRQSAGLSPAPTITTTEPTFVDRLADLATPIRNHEWYRSVQAFLPELEPAWWVLRGYLVVVLAGGLTGTAYHTFPLPSLWGSTVAGLLATVGAVVLSVKWGRSRAVTRWGQRALIGAGILAVIGALVGTASVNAGPETYYVDYDQGAVPIDMTILPANIYAYSPDGTPLGPVLLYNEEGVPIDLPQYGFSEQVGLDYETVYPLDANGRPVPNLYPRDMTYVDYFTNPETGQVAALPPVVGVPTFASDEVVDDQPGPAPLDSAPASSTDPELGEADVESPEPQPDPDEVEVAPDAETEFDVAPEASTEGPDLRFDLEVPADLTEPNDN